MHVERKVRRVQTQVSLHHRGQLIVKFPPHGLYPTPKHSVVHEHHVTLRGDGHLNGSHTQIHRQPNFFNRTDVLHLETVHRVRRILDRLNIKQVVELMTEL